MFTMTDENWRKQNKTIASKIKAILRQEIFTDATFIVQGCELKCHKLILAVGSPYFERMFYHTFSTCDSSPVVLSDITSQAFRIVLNFLYTDKVSFGSETQAFETYEAAGKFEMADLKSECEIYLSDGANPRTIWNNLERASALEMTKVQKKYFNYIQTNTHHCLKEEAFLKTSGDIVMQVMQLERLTISEIELANKLVSWAKTKNPKYLKIILGPFLRHVRFKAMTPKEFRSFTETNPDVISPEEALAILQYLELPCNKSLPKWCCTLPKRILLS